MATGFAGRSFRLRRGLSWWRLGCVRFRFCPPPRIELLSGRGGACPARAPIREEILKKRSAAIDVDGLAGDGTGLRGAEEEGGAGDFIGGLSAALQDCVQKAR